MYKALCCVSLFDWSFHHKKNSFVVKNRDAERGGFVCCVLEERETMLVWVKIEGATDSEAFKIEVKRSRQFDSPNTKATLASPQQAQQNNVQIGDVLTAAVQFFQPSSSSISVTSSTRRYRLYFNGAPIPNDADAERFLSDALEKALQRRTVNNVSKVSASNDTSTVTLQKRQGVVLELRQGIEEADARRDKKKRGTPDANRKALFRDPRHAVEPSAVIKSMTADKHLCSTKDVTLSPQPSHNGSIVAATHPPPHDDNDPSSVPTSIARPLWSPLHIRGKAGSPAPCQSFLALWGAPGVCSHCSFLKSSHALPHSTSPSKSPKRNNQKSASPHRTLEDFLASPNREYRMGSGCSNYLPLWNHNDYCMNCYKPLAVHTSYLELQNRRRQERAESAKHKKWLERRRQVNLLLPWNNVLLFLSVEDLRQVGPSCRFLAKIVRVLLKTVFRLVLSYTIPADVRVRLSSSAHRFAQVLHSKSILGGTTLFAVNTIFERCVANKALKASTEHESSQTTGAKKLSSNDMPLAHRNEGYLDDSTDHLNSAELDFSELVDRLQNLVDIDCITLDASCIEAIHAIPSLSESTEVAASYPSPPERAPSDSPDDSSSVFSLAGDMVAAVARKHKKLARGANRTAVQAGGTEEVLRPLVEFLRNMVLYRNLKLVAQGYIQQSFVPL